MPSMVEVMRRLYHDLVLRRATVHIVSAEERNLSNPPIFIIGAYRSGTTLLRYVLDSHSHIYCPAESNFIADLFPLVSNPRTRIGLERMGFDSSHVTRQLRNLCVYFFENAASAHRKIRWADKTPLYVDYLQFIENLFPESRFVMIYRHGLDQAHSFTRGGTFMRDELEEYCRPGEDLRLGGVRYWRDKVARSLEFEEDHRKKCHRLKYEDLCQSPEKILRAVFDFLEEPWEPEVLEFYRFPHEKGAEDGRAIATRGFSISIGHYNDWPKQLIDRCAAIAEPMLSRLGYSVLR